MLHLLHHLPRRHSLQTQAAEFKNLIADAEFNLVASRSAQAAVIKAIKKGKASVDISTQTTPGDGSDGGGSNTSGDNKGDAGQDGSGEDNEL